MKNRKLVVGETGGGDVQHFSSMEQRKNLTLQRESNPGLAVPKSNAPINELLGECLKTDYK